MYIYMDMSENGLCIYALQTVIYLRNQGIIH